MVSISHCKKKIHIIIYLTEDLLNESSFNIALKKDETYLVIVSTYLGKVEKTLKVVWIRSLHRFTFSENSNFPANNLNFH